MKKTLLLFLMCALFSATQAQELHTKWTQTIKKVSATEYDLIFTVKIDPGHHIYSLKKYSAVIAPNPTKIVFKNSADYEVVETKESKPIEEDDKVFGFKVYYFHTTAVFTTRIKLKTAAATEIKGTYEYQICKGDACTFPPYEDFAFKIPAQKSGK